MNKTKFSNEEWEKYFKKNFPDLVRKYRSRKGVSFIARLKEKVVFFFRQRTVPLCTSCCYNNPRYCHKPQRPFAAACEDYKRK